MNERDVDTLIEIRDICSKLHDSRVGIGIGRNAPLTVTEMAALRDCCHRLTDIIGRENERLQRLAGGAP